MGGARDDNIFVTTVAVHLLGRCISSMPINLYNVRRCGPVLFLPHFEKQSTSMC